MTREEAIHELQEDKRLYETEVCHAGDGSPDGRLLEALDMAIALLSAEATDVYKAHEEEHLNIVNRIKELQYAIAKTQTIVGEMVESAEAEPTAIRSKTLMPTKDFKEWAKRVREGNSNVIVIPCDAELVSAEAVSIHEDGTLEVKVPNAQKVGRVLVMDADSHIGGGLFYPDDAVQGEWIEHELWGHPWHTCSICNYHGRNDFNYCPSCGARMIGGDTK